jgi:hypothetical protein
MYATYSLSIHQLIDTNMTPFLVVEISIRTSIVENSMELLKKLKIGPARWLTPMVLSTREAIGRRITAETGPG